MLRIKNIADRAFGNEKVVGFDDDGFATSLTSAGLALGGGVVLRVFPKDHPPPHVHIEVNSHPNAKIRINLVTGEFMDDAQKSMNKKYLLALAAAPVP